MLTIRKAKPNDNLRITEILNQAIIAGNATAITKILKPEERLEWLNKYIDDKYTIYVAEIEGIVVGWLSLSPYRKGRQAFKRLAEITYYIDYDHHRKGIAKALFEKAADHCKQYNINSLIAFLYAENTASVKLLKKFGFEQWGLFPKTICIGDKELNHVIYGVRLFQ